jgi:hypothetical protein
VAIKLQNYCWQAAKTAANKLQKLLLESCKNCCKQAAKTANKAAKWAAN